MASIVRERLVEIEARIQIGRMVIETAREGYVWLTWIDDAEGMEAEESKLAACLETFYRENF